VEISKDKHKLQNGGDEGRSFSINVCLFMYKGRHPVGNMESQLSIIKGEAFANPFRLYVFSFGGGTFDSRLHQDLPTVHLLSIQ